MSLWSNKDTAAVTGTIGIPNGSPTVTGSGTAFKTELKEGSFIVISGVKYKIYKINSNTSLTLTSNYEGTAIASGATITKHTAPTYLSLADARNAVFVSQDEALLNVNKTKGFTGAGWWLHKEYTDAAGKPRYKSELLVAITTPNSISGDGDATGEDLFASDINAVVTIGTQPTAQTTVSGGATFSVTASVAPSGTVTYQWQRALAATPTRFVNISGATSATRAVTGQTSGNSGDLYRVIVSSTPNGSVKVTSDAVKLTFGT